MTFIQLEMSLPSVGDHVELVQPFNIGHMQDIPVGSRGVVTEVGDDISCSIAVKMDDNFNTLKEWNNNIYFDDRDDNVHRNGFHIPWLLWFHESVKFVDKHELLKQRAKDIVGTLDDLIQHEDDTFGKILLEAVRVIERLLEQQKGN